MSLQAENVIWQYWETHGEKPKFIDGLRDIVEKNSGAKAVLVTPETLGAYLPDLEDEVHRIADPSHKADMIRTRLVMTYGGMWLDSDAVVLRDLNPLFAYLDDVEFVGFNNGGQLQAERPWVRVNCFVSCPNGKVVSEWVRLQRQKLRNTKFEWSESLAAEWAARGIRVNAVAPTYINTPLNAFVKDDAKMYAAWIGGTPMGRMGEVEEIASVVLFLAGRGASLMTGSVVVVDGGYTCW